jgi:hypothetical protein
MLYPYLEFNFDEPSYTLPSGYLGLLSFTVASGETKEFRMRQMIANPYKMPQDLSIRCWISLTKGGAGVVYAPAKQPATWHLSSLMDDVIRVHDADLTVEDDLTAVFVPVTPGTYWLNVLNLVNEENLFGVELSGA